jgi:rhamnosyl/mannosyltransferase
MITPQIENSILNQGSSSEFKHYRIVHLSKYYPPDRGGIESYIQTLARTQSLLGADVHVLCVNTFGNNQEPLTKRTRTTHELDMDVKVTRVGRLFSLMRFDFCRGLTNEIHNLIKEPNTILHLHTPNPTMLFALSVLLSVKKDIPLIITHHSDIIKQKILKFAVRPLEYYIYQKSSLTLATSSNYIEGSKFLRAFRQKLNYAPLVSDIDKYKKPHKNAIEFGQSLKEKYGDTIWVSVGRLVYYKGLNIAIQALQKVRGTLIIIGIGPLEKELKTLVKNLGLENRVVWLGNLTEDELIGAYYAATALWFPSNARSEAFGLVQVEAMACGCPVINTNIASSGVPWVSRHEKEALTVAPNNPVDFSDAANRLLSEPNLRDRLSIAGQKRSDDFSCLNVTRRIFDFYGEVLSQKNY